MTKMSTIYDTNTKIWYGWPREEESLDESVSVGEWALRMMRNKSSNEICQISDPDNTHLKYHEALTNAIQLAKQMRKWQLTCYDIIGVVATNSKYLMQIILAAWFNGLAFHAINPEENVEAIHYMLNKTKPKVIFCDGLYLDKLQMTLHTLYPIVCTVCNHVADDLDVFKIEELLSADDENENLFSTEPLREGCDQTMAILCSSGTSGLPKCVRITNKMCLTNYGLLSEKSLTVFSFCNIDWIFGFHGLLSNILHGNLRIITSQPYTPEYMTHIICKYKVNCLLATSQQISQCINFEPQLLESLKFVLISGSTCFKTNLQQIRSTLQQATVINIYGTSECGGISANFGDYKIKSVGQLFSNVELKIVDEASGEKLGPYEIGLLCVKNKFYPNEMAYYGDVGAFYKILDAEDYIITGDLGFMDSEHYLYLSDRREIVLQYQNYYYSPYEFEVIVAELKGVRDVSVVGVQEEGKGDVPACVIVKEEGCSLTSRDVMNYVNLRRSSLHNCFDYGVFFVKEIPRNHNGKVLVKEVVEMCKNFKK
ncbi:4-coumarate--CoA ligase 4-like [Lucilia sericata]|uniref:4-coumarate--CoA ligase 4-like n=1 Tax=Lucilia sericata TaxID=13632 RepID=UPI0018A804A2|nr:4-coumarate--CoA ligase 4-like [Lucilia sericata]